MGSVRLNVSRISGTSAFNRFILTTMLLVSGSWIALEIPCLMGTHTGLGLAFAQESKSKSIPLLEVKPIARGRDGQVNYEATNVSQQAGARDLQTLGFKSGDSMPKDPVSGRKINVPTFLRVKTDPAEGGGRITVRPPKTLKLKPGQKHKLTFYLRYKEAKDSASISISFRLGRSPNLRVVKCNDITLDRPDTWIKTQHLFVAGDDPLDHINMNFFGKGLVLEICDIRLELADEKDETGVVTGASP